MLSLVSFLKLKLLYSEIPVLGPYHKESAVTAFRWVLRRGLGGGGVMVHVGQEPCSLQGDGATGSWRGGPGSSPVLSFMQ